jgi:hypothetical protein
MKNDEFEDILEATKKKYPSSPAILLILDSILAHYREKVKKTCRMISNSRIGGATTTNCSSCQKPTAYEDAFCKHCGSRNEGVPLS